MARKLEFDYNQALECATKLFWAKGYSSTSLRDLLERMEIGEGSFYNIFKSKKNLYLECLKHYNESVTRRRLAILDSEKSVKKAIRKFFHLLLDELDDPETPRICLMAGSLSTDVLEIPSIQSYVIEEMNLFEKYLFER